MINLDYWIDKASGEMIKGILIVGMTIWVVIFGSLGVYYVLSMGGDDSVIGYTEHGHPITKQDLDNMEKEDGK